MKKTAILIIITLTFGIRLIGQTISIGAIQKCAPSNVCIPVTAVNFTGANELGALSLYVQVSNVAGVIDPATIQITNINPQLTTSGGTLWFNWMSAQSQIGIVWWSGGSVPATIPNGTLFEICFDYFGGSTNFTFNNVLPSKSEAYDFINIANIPVTYSGGSLNQSPLPGAAGVISGSTTVCQGQTGVVYTVGAITNATSYNWVLPPNATITAGAGTSSITVSFANNATSGNVTVNGVNTCGSGTSNSLAITVNPLPATAGVITGPSTVCQGTTATYSTGSILNANSYSWTVPSGATITSVATTNTITVSFSPTAVSGSITVVGVNSCGNGPLGPPKIVTVNNMPIANAGSDILNLPNGDYATLTGSATGSAGPFSYAWSPAGSLLNANVQNPTTTSLINTVQYCLTVTDIPTGCISSPDCMTVNVSGVVLQITNISSIPSPATICIGNSVQLNATVIGGTLTYNYSWTALPAGTISNPNIINPVVTPTVTTVYTLSVHDGANTTTSTKTVTVNPLPTITFPALTPKCINAAPFVFSTATPAGGTYSGTSVSANTFNPSVSGAGTFPITYNYTDAPSTCSNSATMNQVINPLPVVTQGAIAPVCIAHASFALTGGSPSGGTYSGTGVSANVFNPSTSGAGTFLITYTYTDGNGCTNSATTNIVVYPLPVVTFTGTLAAQCIDATTYALTGGLPLGGTYSGAGVTSVTGNFDATSAGGTGTKTITYTYNDINGCTSSATNSIIVNALPVLTFNNLTPICVDQQAINLTTGLPTGGSYNGPGVASNQFSPGTAGVGTHTITYTYTDPNGCTNSKTATIQVYPLPTMSFTALTPVCVSAPLYALSGGTPVGGTYSGPGVSGNNFDPFTAGVGTHTITYTYSDGNGCTNSITSALIVYPLPGVTISPFNPMCVNDPPVVLTGGIPLGGTYSGSGVLTGTFNPTIAGVGIHVITYTYTDNHNCTSSNTATIQVYPLPVVSVAPFAGVCISVPAFPLTGGSPTGGFYSGNGVTGGNFNPAAAGVGTHTITYTYTDGNGCTGIGSNTIQVYALPVVTWPNVLTNQCVSSTTYSLSGGLPAGGTYSGTGVTGTNFNASVTGAGTFTLTYTYTNVNGCTSSATNTITVYPLPIVQFNGTLTAQCVSSTTYTLTGGFPVGGIYSGNGVTGSNFNASNAGTGNHTITYTYTDLNGCTSSATNTITVYPLPNVTFNGTLSPQCETSLTYTLTGGSPPGGTYSGPGVSGTNFNASSVGPGVYTITYTFTDANGCTSSANNTITVNPLPIVTFTGTLTPQCESATTYTLTGGSPAGGTYSGPGVTGTNFNASVAGDGTHTLTYTYTDGNGCTSSATNTIVVNPLPIADAGSTQNINNGQWTLLSGNASNGSGSYSYQWTPSAMISGAATISNPQTVNLGSTTTFTLIVTDLNTGCVSQPSQVLISVSGGILSVTATANPTTICVGGSIDLSATASGGNNVYTYSWTSVPVGFTSTQANISGLNPIVPTVYTVTVNDLYNNASSQASVTVNPLPVVTFTGPLTAQCISSTTFALTTGLPIGGTYSGPGVTGTNFNASLAGVGLHTLTYTYTNTNNCTSSASTFIQVNPLPVVTWPTVLPALCISVPSYVLTGGLPAGGTYSGTGVVAGSFFPSSAGPGTHTLTYTYKNPLGCINSVTNTIVVNSLPVVTFTGTLAAQCITSTTYVLTGGFPLGGTYSGCGVTGINFNASLCSPGITTITYTYTDANSCTNSATNTIIVNPLPNVTFTGTLAAQCVSSTAYNITGGSPPGGTYSGCGVTGTNFNASLCGPSGVTTLTYTYTNLNNCTNSATNTIMVNALPIVTWTNPLPAQCVSTNSFILTGGLPAGGTYSGCGVTGNVFNPSLCGVGTHTLTYTYKDGNNCINSTTNTIIVNPLPIVTFTGPLTPVCVSSTSYLLTGGNPAGGTYSGTCVTGNIFNPNCAGVGLKTITYTYTDGNGCTSSATANIVVNPLPVVTWPTALPGQCVSTTIFNLSGGLPAGGTYSGPCVTGTTFDPNCFGAGINTMTYTYTNANGCTNSTTNTITVNPLPVVTWTNTLIPQCVSSTTYTLSGGLPVGGTYSGCGVTGNNFNPSLCGVGTHTLTYTYKDGNNCINTATNTIIVNPLPVVTCTGTLAQQCVSATTYALSGCTPLGGTYSGTGVTAGNFDATVSGVGVFTITYTYTDGNGCTNTSTNSITVVPLPNVIWPTVLQNQCVSSTSYILTGGFPTGGTYSGPGVTNGVFDASSLPVGTYTLTYTYTNANNCTKSVTNTITVLPLPLVTWPGTLPSQCVSLTAYTLSGGLPIGGNYSGCGVTGIIFNPSLCGVGTHTLTYTYTNPSGCTNTITSNIVVNPLPVVTFNNILPDVCVSSTVYPLTGGSPAGGTYSGPGVFGTNFNPSIAGVGTQTITYTYTDPNGCTNSATNTVLVNPLPIAWAGNDTTIFNGAYFSLYSSVSGGSGNYSYSWTPTALINGSATIPNPITVNLANTTTYTLLVTDITTGCISLPDTKQVTVSGGPITAAASAIPNELCIGNQTQLFAVGGGGNGIYTYKWSSNPTGYSSTTQNPFVVPPTTTTYTVTVYDPFTSATSSVTVIVNPLPVITVGTYLPVCIDHAPFQLNTATPTGGTYTGPGITANTFFPAISGVGLHTITYTFTDGKNCTNSGTFTILVNPLPNVSFNGTLADQCVSATTYLLSTGLPIGGTYSGNGVTGTNLNPSVAGVGTHILTYTYTDGNGCTNSATNTITVLPVPVATATTSTPEICSGFTANLSGNFSGGSGSILTWTWSGPSGYNSTSQNPVITNAAVSNSGTYSLTVTDVNGCSSVITATTSVLVNPLPTATATVTPSTYCTGSTIQLNGSATGGTGPNYTYNWSSSTGFTSIVANPTIPNAQTTSTGTYSLTVTDVKSCSSVNVASVSILVNPLPIGNASAVQSVICAGSNLQLLGTASNGSGSGYSYVWSGPGGFSSNVQDPIITNAQVANSGNYCVTVTDGNSCVSVNSACVSITVRPLPTVFATAIPNTLCTGSNLTLTGSASGGSGPVYTYLWSGPGSYSSSAAISTINNVTTANSGIYSLTCTDQYNCPSINISSVTVTIYSLPTASAATSFTEVCAGSTINLLGTGNVGSGTGYSYVWTGPNGFYSTMQNPTILNAQTMNSGTYSLVVTDSHGCVSVNTANVTITVYTLPLANTSIVLSALCSGAPLQINGWGTVGSGTGYNYSWSGPSGFTSSLQNILIPASTVNNSGQYCLTVTDSHGCISTNTACVDVTIYPLPTASAFVNQFSICANNDIILTGSALGGNPATYSFVWSGPNGWTSTLQNPNIISAQPINSGLYCVTVTDANGCSSINTACVNVTVNPLPVANAGPDVTINYNTSTTLTGSVTPSIGNYSYTWNPSTMLLGGINNTQTVNTVLLTATQIYTLVVTDLTTNCSSLPDPIVVNNQGGPLGVALSATPDTICAGTSVFLNSMLSGGNLPITFAWSSVPAGVYTTAQNQTVAPVVTTTYTITATDNTSQVKNASITVVVNNVTASVIAGIQTICSGENPAAFLIVTPATGSGTLSYQWQSASSVAGLFGDITGATGATYDPPALSVNTWYRVIVSSTLGTHICTAISNVINITINNVSSGTIAGSQTICNGDDPVAFTETLSATGSGPLIYQWQSALAAVGTWINIAGANSPVYDPPSLTVDTWYRRVVTSTLNSKLCDAISNVLHITINNVTASVIAADQTICNGDDPATFTITTPPTGTGTLTYQWQNATTATGSFNDLGGENASTLDPPPLTSDRWYRVVVKSTLNGVECSAISNVLHITVNQVTAGVIANDQTICNGDDPAAFTEPTIATGSGVLSYQWQSASTSGGPWNTMASALSATYDPGPLTVDTWYRRIVTSTINGISCSDTSNILAITINNVTAGVIAADQTICNNSDPAAFTVTTIETGTGTLTYQWQSSTTAINGPFVNINGEIQSTYDPPALTVNTWYRRVTTSTLNGVTCSANSNVLAITINNITASVIAADQTICSGNTPAPFTVTTTAVGTGTLTYQWQDATNAFGPFTDISGASSPTFTPPALTVNTWYQVIVTSTLNGVPCSATSNMLKITINDVTAGVISTDQTICNNTVPAPFTVFQVSTGTGTLTHQWQSATALSGPYNDIPGATSDVFASGALTVNTWFRRVVTSTLNGIQCSAISNILAITINNVTASVIAADQTICSGGDPASFTIITPATGTGTLSYQWQSTSVVSGSFADITNENNPTFDPAALTSNTWYRVVVTSTLNNVLCTATSNVVAITINDVTASVIAADQTICSNTIPVPFTVTTNAAGSGTLTYQWQNSTAATGPWTNILTGTNATFAPPALTVNTWYRVVVISTLNNIACTAISNELHITINNVTASVIAADQTICSGFAPQPLTISTPATGTGTLSYQWQSATSATGPFGDINNANNPTFAPPTLTVNTWYRVVVTSTLNGVPCSAISNVISITINNVTASVIAADQTICSGTPPAPFTVSTPATGSGGLTYQWQSKSAVGDPWTSIPGALNPTYAPPALTSNTWFQVVVTSALNNVNCTATSNVIQITINNVTAGVIAASQTICNNTIPAAFTVSTAATGSGPLTYQWQSATAVSGPFTNIANELNPTYAPPALTVNMWYRRVAISTLITNVACSAISNVVVITINNVTGGTIAADQTICNGGDPQAFTIIIPPTGSGPLTYQWQTGTSATGPWSNITGAQLATFDPNPLTVETWFQRVVTSTLNGVLCTATSNIIHITINNVNAGVIVGDQTICSGDDPGVITVSPVPTGSGTLSYQWQSAPSAAGTWQDIPGANSSTYDPPALTTTTFYHLKVTSTLNGSSCSATSNSIKITINSITAGVIAGDQTICNGADPVAFTVTTVSTGSGTLSYQWQSSPTATGIFTNINAANGSTYDPPALTVNTCYRRVSYSTVNANQCSAISNVICVTINDVTGGTVTADQTICSGDDPAAFTVTTVSTGSGTLTYQWQSAANSAGPWTNINGAANPTFDPIALTSSTCYRRVTTSHLNLNLCDAFSNTICVTVNSVTGGVIASAQTICSGQDPAPFTGPQPPNGSGILTYQWQSGTSATGPWTNIAGATGLTYDPPVLTTSMWYVRITNSALGSVNCTASSNVIKITVNPLPIANAGTNATINYGCTTTLSGSVTGGTSTYVWAWTPAALLANAVIAAPTTVALTATQQYILRVQDNATGCWSLNDTVLVTVNGTALAVNVNATPSIVCHGDATLLNAQPSGGNQTYTYSWSSVPTGFSSAIKSPTATPNLSTIYKVTVSDGCTTTSGSVSVSVTPKAQVYSGISDTICMGNQFQAILATAANYDSLLWTKSGDGSFVDPHVLNAVYIHGPQDFINGTVTLSLTAYGQTPCGDSVHSLVLTISEKTTAFAGNDDSICAGWTYYLAGATSTNANVLEWTTSGTGAFNDPTTQNPVYTPSSYDITVGSVTLSLHSVNTAIFCGDTTDNMILKIKPLPPVNAGTDKTICIYDTVQLTATGGDSYLWGPPTGLSALNIANPNAYPLATTLYVVTATLNGCSAPDSITVFVNPLPPANAGPDLSICHGDSAMLSGSGGFTYLWSNGSTMPITFVSPAATASYYLSVTDLHGCKNVDTVEVVVHPIPPVYVTPATPAICKDSTIRLTGNGASTYSWGPSNGLSGVFGPNVNASPKQTMTYTLKGMSTFGCIGTAEVTVRVFATPVTILTDTTYLCMGNTLLLNAGYNDYCDFQWQDGTYGQFYQVEQPGIYFVTVRNDGCVISDTTVVDICTNVWVPSAFTPDGNNINDYFVAKSSTKLKDFTMRIYSRSGELIYITNDIYKGWDGTNNGSDAPQGVYVYEITYKGQANIAKDSEGLIRGTVTLIR